MEKKDFPGITKNNKKLLQMCSNGARVQTHVVITLESQKVQVLRSHESSFMVSETEWGQTACHNCTWKNEEVKRLQETIVWSKIWVLLQLSKYWRCQNRRVSTKETCIQEVETDKWGKINLQAGQLKGQNQLISLTSHTEIKDSLFVLQVVS